MSYSDFIATKKIADQPDGFEPQPIQAPLFQFQADLTKWAIRRGRAAIFADCGVGKTPMQLEWSHQVARHTNKPVLILAPLSVAEQTCEQSNRFGIECRLSKSQADVQGAGVYISNYEKLHRFDCGAFAGVALDESGILKSLDGKIRTQTITNFRRTPFKSAWTATPAPNDFMELGNHAEFFGVMTRGEMLAMFFTHDGGDTAKWRLKGHAQSEFWKWLCSWAVNIRKPSDLGYSDEGYALPELRTHEHIIDMIGSSEGLLFSMPASSLAERRAARRESLSERVDKTVEIATASGRKTLIWCNLNDEQDAIEEALAGAVVSIRGATPPEERVELEAQWRKGSIPFLVTKPAIFGWGMNWQHCAKEIFCGITDSYEEIYQAVRRCWRFGQEHPVDVHFILSSVEQAVLVNIKRKQAEADRMAKEMIKHMADISAQQIKGLSHAGVSYKPTIKMEVPSWLKAA